MSIHPIVRPVATFNNDSQEFECSPTRDQAIISAAISSCFGSGEADKAIVSACKEVIGANQNIFVDFSIRLRGAIKTQKPRVCAVKAKDNYKAALIEMLEDDSVPQSVKDRIRISFSAESARRNGFDTKTILTTASAATRSTIEGMEQSLPDEVTYPPAVSATITWETIEVPASTPITPKEAIITGTDEEKTAKAPAKRKR
jgi:hypothetical protein